jgi:DNA polymerase-4
MPVFHLDIESFMTAVARVEDTALCKRPLVVAPDTARATLMAASPDAKALGIQKGMLARHVVRHFPDVKFIQPDHRLYQKAAAAVLQIASHFTPVVEPIRYGHVALDMTGMQRLFGSLENAAGKLRQELSQRLQLNSTIGIAHNKLVSQIAAKEIQKHQEALYRVDQGDESHFLAPLPCRVLPDTERSHTKRLLFELNLRMVRHIQNIPRDIFSFALGKLGTQLHRHAFGIDSSGVQAPQEHKQLHADHHFQSDTNDDQVLLATLYRLLEDLTKQLRARKQQAKRLDLMLLYSDDVTRRRTIRLRSTDQEQIIYRQLKHEFPRWCDRRCRVSYVQIHLAGLHGYEQQLELFAPTKATRPINPTLDRIRNRFGRDAIQFGFSMQSQTA